METTFDNQMFEFISSIRQESSVGKTTEKTIRKNIDSIIHYRDAANKVRYLVYNRNKKAFAEAERNALEAISLSDNEEDKRDAQQFIDTVRPEMVKEFDPITFSFSDVAEIACTLGMYVDERSWLKRNFTRECPMKKRLEAYVENFEFSKSKQNFDPELFDAETEEALLIASDGEKPDSERVIAGNEMIVKSCEYINRYGQLRLAYDCRDDIIAYHEEEDWKSAGREARNEMKFFLFGDSEPFIKRTKILGDLIKKQAEIDAIRFKILNICTNRLKGFEDPIEEMERAYQGFIDSYKNCGLICAEPVEVRK